MAKEVEEIRVPVDKYQARTKVAIRIGDRFWSPWVSDRVRWVTARRAGDEIVLVCDEAK